MTVNIVSQLSLQPTTTFNDLIRWFKEPKRAGQTLIYEQQLDDRRWLEGSFGDPFHSEPFMRSSVLRPGPAWRVFHDTYDAFAADPQDVTTPDWASLHRDALIAQRVAYASLRPRLEELHAQRVERLRASGLTPKLERAWRDLPVLEYLEATKLLDTATFHLVPARLLRMSWSSRVKTEYRPRPE